MRFMLIVKATSQSEAGVMPSQTLLQDMGRFNEDMVRAGVLLAADGLQPSSRGARVRFVADTKTVTEGPFAETNELIAGYWLIQVNSREEAIDWALRSPKPHSEDCEIEVRQLFELEDFPELPNDVREMEERFASAQAPTV
jgi:hypothetical protein